MSPLKRSQNFAARMGRWSAGHWKTAVVAWFAFVVLALFMGMQIGTKNIDKNDANVGETRTADRIINDAGFNLDKKGENIEEQGEMVLFQSTSRTLTVKDPAFRAAIKDAEKTLARFPQVRQLRSPLAAGEADLISNDSRSAMLRFTPTGTYEEAVLYIDKLVAAVDRVESRHPGFLIDETGSVSTQKEVQSAIRGGLKKAGLVSIPLTIVILMIILGSFVAALIPLLLGITSVVATMGLIAFASRLVPMSEDVMEVALLIGLAVGVDYALFYIRREREERKAGRREGAALEASAATSGRSVLISGITVLIAMAGMLFSGDKDFKSFAVGTIMVVAVAMLGSLTVLPAVLSKLGDRVEKGRIPFLGRLRRPSGENRVWSKVLTPALRHPVIAAAASAAVLLAMAVPVLHLHTAQSGIDGLPRNAPTVETLDRIQDAFVGTADPAVIAVTTPSTDSAEFKNAYNAFRGKALASGQMHGPVQLDANKSHTVARITISLAGNGVDAKSNAALAVLRNDVLPSTIGTLQSTDYAVTGGTAASHDQNAAMKHSAPLVFGFVLLLAFLLLLVSFRSIVIAAKAVVLNLLSVGAAYGVVIAIFQWGWGENILHFRSHGVPASWPPIFIFVILFRHSMASHVFIMSRVRE